MVKIKEYSVAKIACILLLCLATLGIVMLLAGTIQYSYLDEKAHYHENICHLNNCSMSVSQCCKTSNHCETCYKIGIIYELILLNITNDVNITYTKISQDIVYDPNYCDQTTIFCYYDDRRIIDSLSIWNIYTLKNIIGVILILSVGVFVMALMTSIVFYMLYCKKSTEIYENDNHESEPFENSDDIALHNTQKNGYQTV